MGTGPSQLSGLKWGGQDRKVGGVTVGPWWFETKTKSVPPSSSWCTEEADIELYTGQVRVESVRLHSNGGGRLRSSLGKGLYLLPSEKQLILGGSQAC